LIGTVLLKLPASTSGPGVSWLAALFEATIAVTVTGLQVAPSPANSTIFGESILAVLIQAGALERVMNLAYKPIRMRITRLARFPVGPPFSALASHS
jgi:hypothetical protein